MTLHWVKKGGRLNLDPNLSPPLTYYLLPRVSEDVIVRSTFEEITLMLWPSSATYNRNRYVVYSHTHLGVPNNSLCMLIYFDFSCQSAHTLFESTHLIKIVFGVSLLPCQGLYAWLQGSRLVPDTEWFHPKCIINCFEERIWCLCAVLF